MEQNGVRFLAVSGVIVAMQALRGNGKRLNPCVFMVQVEDDDGNTFDFMITPNTYVADEVKLTEGMNCTFWYHADSPAVLMYPPRYQAAVVAERRTDRFVDVGFFNFQLINEEKTLQLRPNLDTIMETVNHQTYFGNPANHELVVFYQSATKSRPAKTTPYKIVVLCFNP